jgi:hypothetical protein
MLGLEGNTFNREKTDIGSYKDINEALKPLEEKHIPTGIILSACYAGYGIDDLQAARRFVVTEVSKDQLGDYLSGFTAYIGRAYTPWKFTGKPFAGSAYGVYIYSLDADVSPKDNKLTALELINWAIYIT